MVLSEMPKPSSLSADWGYSAVVDGRAGTRQGLAVGLSRERPPRSASCFKPHPQQNKGMSMNANDLRPGMIIRHNNDLFTIYKAEHRTPGNLRAFVQARMRNLRTGALADHRFRSEDTVERANIDEIEMQYLYSDGDSYYFMNTANYEQINLHKDSVGDRATYLVADILLKVDFFEGRPVDIQLPATVDLKVVQTEPGIKGGSATNVTKPATLETGVVVQVPPFIDAGETIRVDTTEGKYIERANG